MRSDSGCPSFCITGRNAGKWNGKVLREYLTTGFPSAAKLSGSPYIADIQKVSNYFQQDLDFCRGGSFVHLETKLR